MGANMKDIRIIRKNLKKQNRIIDIIIVIVILVTLYSILLTEKKIMEVYFPFIIFLLLVVRITAIFSISRIKRLEKDSELSNELNNILLYSQNGGYMLTDKFIIPNFSKSQIIRYGDIVLLYTKSRLRKGGVDEYLYIVTKNGKMQRFLIDTTSVCVGYDASPVNFTDIILEKNPNVLIGDSEDNLNYILEKYNIKLSI